MVDEAPDQAKPLPVSAGEHSKKSEPDVEVLPKSKDVTGPKAAASHFLEMMSVQSGAAALASSFAKLPEGVQRQTLENEAQRDKLTFELEAKQLEAMAADRESERKDRLVRFEKILVRDSDKDRREFWFGVMLVVLAAIGVGLLGWAGQWTIASHVINTLVAGLLAWQGGKSAGLAKAAKRQQLAAGDDNGKNKDDP